MYIHHSTKEHIVQIVSTWSSMTTRDIQTALFDQHHPLKQAQLYNILNELIRERVLRKEGWSYRLHPERISKMIGFSDHLRIRQEINSLDISTLSSKRVGSDTFLTLNQLWPYYASLLFTHTQATQQWKYCQHHTYTLSGYKHDSSQPGYFTMPWVQRYEICSGTSLLDEYTLTLLQPHPTTIYATTPQPLLWYTGYNINIIGDYLLQIHLWPRLSQALNDLYQTITHLTQFDVETLRSLLVMNEPCTLLILHDPAQADRWKKELKKVVR